MENKKKITHSDFIWEGIRRVAQKSDSRYGFIKEYQLFYLTRYQQPTRKSIPKGEKIGFSEKKLQAAILIGVTNLQLKEIAKACGVSYGLLRKWKTEDDFSNVYFVHAVGFTKEIIKRAKKDLNDRAEEIESYYDTGGINPLEYDPKKPLDDYQRILIDAPAFSETVKMLLLDYISILQKEIKATEGDEFDRKYALIYKLLEISCAANQKTTILPPRLVKLFVNRIRDILASKRVLSKRGQREVLINLLLTERAIDSYQDEFTGLYNKIQPKGKLKQKMEKFFSAIAEHDEIYEILNSE